MIQFDHEYEVIQVWSFHGQFDHELQRWWRGLTCPILQCKGGNWLPQLVFVDFHFGDSGAISGMIAVRWRTLLMRCWMAEVTLQQWCLVYRESGLWEKLLFIIGGRVNWGEKTKVEEIEKKPSPLLSILSLKRID